MKLQIGNVTLPNPVVLAPMAGVTDLPFRLPVQRTGRGTFVYGDGQCQGHLL